VLASATLPSFGVEAVTEAFPADRVDEIDIETSLGPISLTASDASAITVSAGESGDECAVGRKLQGGILTLFARGPSKKMFALDKACAAGYEVSAPPGVRIKAHSIGGNVDVGAFSGRVEVKTGTGEISLRRPTGALEVHSAKGNITGEASGAPISVVTQGGFINLTGLTGTVAARTSEGGVLLAWSRAPQRGEINVLTEAGEQRIFLPADGLMRISMRSASGSTKSDFPSDAHSELQLDLRSTTGPITVAKQPQQP
jgi:hypothetical protein